MKKGNLFGKKRDSVFKLHTKLDTVEPLHNGHPGAELSGRCWEVSIRVKCMIGAWSGRKILAVVERWPL